jgi:hypothetical protein
MNKREVRKMAKKITIEVADNDVVKRDGDKIIFEIPVDRVKDLFDKKVKLASIPIGETFKIGDEEWIVLEQSGDTTAVLKKDLLPGSHKFDNNTNNFAKSEIYSFLNDEYYVRLAALIGTNNICEHTVDLTADDGLRDYKKCKAYVSLLTCELYRKYTDIMLKYNPKQWWWLATAYSTPTRGYNGLLRCVYDDGTLYDHCCSDDCCVRPFCILKSCCEVVR